MEYALSTIEWRNVFDEALREVRQKQLERAMQERFPLADEVGLTCATIERIAKGIIAAKKYSRLVEHADAT